MQNITSLERREIAVTLPLPPDDLWSIVASPDGRDAVLRSASDGSEYLESRAVEGHTIEAGRGRETHRTPAITRGGSLLRVSSSCLRVFVSSWSRQPISRLMWDVKRKGDAGIDRSHARAPPKVF